MGESILKPAYDAALEALNFVKHELQGEPTSIDLIGLTANNADEVISTLKGNWVKQEVSLGLGVWTDEFRVKEGAITEEDFRRVVAVIYANRKMTMLSKKRPEGTRRYWQIIIKPVEMTNG